MAGKKAKKLSKKARSGAAGHKSPGHARSTTKANSKKFYR